MIQLILLISDEEYKRVMMVLKQLNWKQGKTCSIQVYKPQNQY